MVCQLGLALAHHLIGDHRTCLHVWDVGCGWKTWGVVHAKRGVDEHRAVVWDAHCEGEVAS